MPAAPSTRDRIMIYLAEHPSVSAADLSTEWGLTRADIRYHLAALLEDGLIEPAPRSPGHAGGRGRPAQAYRLSVQSRPNNLPALCHVLLVSQFNSLSEAETPAVAHQLAAALAGSLLENGTLSPNLTRRLSQVIELLNRAHYRARWEASAQGPRILLRACPYTALLAQHPELCQVDHALLEHLLQAGLRHTTRQNPLTGKPPACIFTAL